MNIETKIDGSTVTAVVQGEIDGKTAPQVQSELLAALKDGDRLMVDLKDVTYLSSAGLRMLLLLYRQISAKKGKVVLVGMSEEIIDTMTMTGFINFFIIAETQEAGLLALS